MQADLYTHIDTFASPLLILNSPSSFPEYKVHTGFRAPLEPVMDPRDLPPALPHHSVIAHMYRNDKIKPYAVVQQPFADVYHWRCIHATCAQVNYTRTCEKAFWYNRPCKSCGRISGREVCLLQITMARANERLNAMVWHVHGFGAPPIREIEQEGWVEALPRGF